MGRDIHPNREESQPAIPTLIVRSALCLHGRDAEWTLAAIAIGYPHAKKGPWAIGLAPQLLLQVRQPRHHTLGLDLLKRDPVRARSTAVGTAVPVCLPEHIFSAHLVPEAVKAIAGFGFGFRPATPSTSLGRSNRPRGTHGPSLT